MCCAFIWTREPQSKKLTTIDNGNKERRNEILYKLQIVARWQGIIETRFCQYYNTRSP